MLTSCASVYEKFSVFFFQQFVGNYIRLIPSSGLLNNLGGSLDIANVVHPMYCTISPFLGTLQYLK